MTMVSMKPRPDTVITVFTSISYNILDLLHDVGKHFVGDHQSVEMVINSAVEN